MFVMSPCVWYDNCSAKLRKINKLVGNVYKDGKSGLFWNHMV